MKITLLLFTVFLGNLIYAQNKKEKIEILNSRVDSLIILLNEKQSIISNNVLALDKAKADISNLGNRLLYIESNQRALDSILKVNNDAKNKILMNQSEFQAVFLEQNRKSDSIIHVLSTELEQLKTQISKSIVVTPEKKVICSDFELWKIKIGAEYTKIAKYFKEKKDNGVLEQLDISGDSSHKSIHAIGNTKLDGALTYECHSIYSYFRDNLCVGFKLIYGFKSDYPADLFFKQISDMERLAGTKAILTKKTDEVGNVTNVAKINKDQINILIVDDSDAFAPIIKIYCTNAD